MSSKKLRDIRDNLDKNISSIKGLDDKEAGHLIKHSDWNNLVSSVSGIGNALASYITETNKSITKLEGLLEPLLNQYIVKMSTSKVNYALGELCVITAEITDLSGEKVTTRPWIDFISTWGQMRAALGFSSEVDASGSSISIRANADGIAKVLVKTAHIAHLTATQEDQIATTMEATLPSGQFFAETIIAAPTPSSNTVKAAFGLMTAQYEQAQSGPLQLFIDNYQLPQYYPVLPHLTWQKYRAIVVAYVKDDSDPTTPDASKGSSTIQVTFRDWIGPWVAEYVNDYADDVSAINENIGSHIGNGDLARDLERVQENIGKTAQNKGKVGRQRYYNGVIATLNQMRVTTPPDYFSDLKQSLINAVTLQQIQEVPALASQGTQLGGTPALSAAIGISSHAATAKDVASRILNSFDTVQASNRDLSDKIAIIDADLKSTQKTSIAINDELSSIGQNVLQINTLDQDSVKNQIGLITSQIGQISAKLK